MHIVEYRCNWKIHVRENRIFARILARRPKIVQTYRSKYSHYGKLTIIDKLINFDTISELNESIDEGTFRSIIFNCWVVLFFRQPALNPNF